MALQPRLRLLAPGLTPAGCSTSWLEYPLFDVETPTTDERVPRLTRYSQPEKAVARLLQRPGKTLPDQPSPKLISSDKLELPGGFVMKTYAVSPRKIPAKPGCVKK